jgi:PilZ domain
MPIWEKGEKGKTIGEETLTHRTGGRGRESGKIGSKDSHMAPEANRRRSERVMLRMTVVVTAEDEERRQIQEQADTQVVNAHGGLLRMKQHLHMGQSFLLTNPRNRKEISCRVVRTEEEGMEFYKVAFEFDRPASNFWPIVFPPADWQVPALK